jgi:tetrahydromethanopterin S-methyltransferase subunit E
MTQKADNKVIAFIVVICILAVAYLTWNCCKDPTPKTSNCIYHYMDGDVYAEYENGTIIKMS